VNAANSLIDKNSQQIRKTIFSEKETGKLIKLLNVFTDLEEGAVVAQHISALHYKDKFDFQQIAILYRTNSQSRVSKKPCAKKEFLTGFMVDCPFISAKK